MLLYQLGRVIPLACPFINGCLPLEPSMVQIQLGGTGVEPGGIMIRIIPIHRLMLIMPLPFVRKLTLLPFVRKLSLLPRRRQKEKSFVLCTTKTEWTRFIGCSCRPMRIKP